MSVNIITQSVKYIWHMYWYTVTDIVAKYCNIIIISDMLDDWMFVKNHLATTLAIFNNLMFPIFANLIRYMVRVKVRGWSWLGLGLRLGLLQVILIIVNVIVVQLMLLKIARVVAELMLAVFSAVLCIEMF